MQLHLPLRCCVSAFCCMFLELLVLGLLALVLHLMQLHLPLRCCVSAFCCMFLELLVLGLVFLIAA
jgi:hypothetical protein